MIILDRRALQHKSGAAVCGEAALLASWREIKRLLLVGGSISSALDIALARRLSIILASRDRSSDLWTGSGSPGQADSDASSGPSFLITRTTCNRFFDILLAGQVEVFFFFSHPQQHNQRPFSTRPRLLNNLWMLNAQLILGKLALDVNLNFIHQTWSWC